MGKLELDSVVKKYGNLKAVNQLSFVCDDGQFVAMLGPSGAGKTSTLRMIAGLETVDAGKISIDGKIVNDDPVDTRNVAMAFERYVLYPNLNVEENIAFPLNVPFRKKQYTKNQIRDKVKKLTEFLEIDEYLHRNVTQLSGGQRQRVSFARAIIRDANLYLLDEPLAHLDAKLRNRLRGELKKIFANEGKTIVYVTHDFKEAMSMASKIVIIDQGNVRQIAPPDDIYNSPKDMVVADMVGDPPMNFLDCKIVQEKGNYIVKGDSIHVKLNQFWNNRIKALNQIPEELIIGIRPIYAKPDISENGKSESNLEGKVFISESAGLNQIVTASIGKSKFKFIADENYRTEINQNIRISINKNKISLFDKQTKLAI